MGRSSPGVVSSHTHLFPVHIQKYILLFYQVDGVCTITLLPVQLVLGIVQRRKIDRWRTLELPYYNLG